MTIDQFLQDLDNIIRDEEIEAIENAIICGNCKYFKPYGVMGFDGYSEVCISKGEFNMKDRYWDDKGCNRFERE